MPDTTLLPELRPATLEDAAIVADLESLRDPTEPRDPVLLRHWWRMADEHESSMRRVAVRDGAAFAYVGASHEHWQPEQGKFGVVRPMLRSDVWSEPLYDGLVQIGEQWLREEGASTSVVRVRADQMEDLGALENLGYREDRRMRTSELDLVVHRERILALRDKCREQMLAQGVRMLALGEDQDPDKYEKLYKMVIESEKDIPTTVPWRELTFDEWNRFWFDNPAISEHRFWIAREGDAIIGTSVLDHPVVRGVAWTAYTGTARSVRGRGVARALKYESIGQAIEEGVTRVRTNNDADNPAILRINQEMGYRLVMPIIELHRPLD